MLNSHTELVGPLQDSAEEEILGPSPRIVTLFYSLYVIDPLALRLPYITRKIVKRNSI